MCEFIFGLEDIVADIQILETGSNSCALGPWCRVYIVGRYLENYMSGCVEGYSG